MMRTNVISEATVLEGLLIVGGSDSSDRKVQLEVGSRFKVALAPDWAAVSARALVSTAVLACPSDLTNADWLGGWHQWQLVTAAALDRLRESLVRHSVRILIALPRVRPDAAPVAQALINGTIEAVSRHLDDTAKILFVQGNVGAALRQFVDLLAPERFDAIPVRSVITLPRMPIAVSSAPEGQTRGQRAARAERAILASVGDILATRPFRELTVDEVMANTGLSRSAFYQYFSDLNAVAAQLWRQMLDRRLGAAEPWLDRSCDPRTGLRQWLGDMVRIYRAEGRLMRAITDAAAHSPALEQMLEQDLEHFIGIAAARIGELGAVPAEAAFETASALVWMNSTYLIRRVLDPNGPDDDQAIEALFAIWANRILPPVDKS